MGSAMLGNNGSTPFHVISDATIATGAVVVPMWVYEVSAVAGMITAVVGVLLVLVRLMCAIRDWNKGEKNG